LKRQNRVVPYRLVIFFPAESWVPTILHVEGIQSRQAALVFHAIELEN